MTIVARALRLVVAVVCIAVVPERARADGPGRAPTAVATFAGGCFWCMQPPFEPIPGVVATTVGYTGGHVAHPTYEQVSAGGTGHVEAVQVTYDPTRVTFADLLDVFWHNVDPLAAGGQFCDLGPEYRSIVFVHDDAQRRAAEASKRALEASRRFDRPIVTEILPASTFWPAEEYHQRYHEKNPVRYRFYRWKCGRDQRLRELWGDEVDHPGVPPAASGAPSDASGDRRASAGATAVDASDSAGEDVRRPDGAGDARDARAARDAVGSASASGVAPRRGAAWSAATFRKPDAAALRRMLTPEQFAVTQEEATEAPFRNAYWHEERPGIYVDVVSGEPLFSSRDKFDSGTGWPSFTRPLEPTNVRERVDHRLFLARTEVRSAHAGSHLGHVFDDGPAPTGKRYCMNSAALRFVPAERLAAEGYGQYVPLFATAATETDAADPRENSR